MINKYIIILNLVEHVYALQEKILKGGGRSDTFAFTVITEFIFIVRG